MEGNNHARLLEIEITRGTKNRILTEKDIRNSLIPIKSLHLCKSIVEEILDGIDMTRSLKHIYSDLVRKFNANSNITLLQKRGIEGSRIPRNLMEPNSGFFFFYNIPTPSSDDEIRTFLGEAFGGVDFSVDRPKHVKPEISTKTTSEIGVTLPKKVNEVLTARKSREEQVFEKFSEFFKGRVSKIQAKALKKRLSNTWNPKQDDITIKPDGTVVYASIYMRKIRQLDEDEQDLVNAILSDFNTSIFASQNTSHNTASASRQSA